MSVATVLFIANAVVVVVAAAWMVGSRNLVHSMTLHVITLVALAGIFLLLGSEFLAAVQVLIYAGAVTVMLVFGLMQTPLGAGVALDHQSRGRAAATSIALLIAASVSLWANPWGSTAGKSQGALRLGLLLFGKYLIPFEVVSAVLLAALIGVIFVAEDSGSVASVHRKREEPAAVTVRGGGAP